MLLRTSISSTKKFFQKTLQSFKSFLSAGGYQRLPKSTPCGSFPCNSGGTDQLKFTQNCYRESNKHSSADYSSPRGNNNHYIDLSEKAAKKKVRKNKVEKKDEEYPKKRKIEYQGKKGFQEISMSKVVREERRVMIAKKLKELEMMDKRNVEHVLDIEEVLHYYSRLTCPAYLDIVDTFFFDIYSQFY